MIQFYAYELSLRELSHIKLDLRTLAFVFLAQFAIPLLVELNPNFLLENYHCELHCVLCSVDRDAFLIVLEIFLAQRAVVLGYLACL